MDNIARLLDTGTYSDLQLSSRGKTYNTHRVIVCYQSSVIKDKIVPIPIPTAYGSSSQNPFTFVYKYSFEDEDDPQCVDCAVQYFYRLDYEVPGCGHSEKTEHGLVHKDDADSSPENTKVNLGSDLIIHVKVFALACKYEIHKLKSLSVAKFEAAAQQYGKTHYFTDAAREAYNSAALDNTREMRDSVVEFLHKRRYLLHEDHVKTLMLDKPQLSLDLHLHGPIIPTYSSSNPGFGRGFHQIKK
ncbi:hypothetical protein FOPG_17736 [Fusarium oxysporum f. sp. conglutinans race 2 54008]|jgi:hypothetical protein|uniref:BTB domain-containing protein n=1 Tax=Fusarium oxysporum f. sp. conglutinans race 2 54008 TaxID=1089457 RepID=X0GRU2_FUSOX|nr:hypothetical protein FOPG_17736 [Fusarium oxysporum f. sp. conglutinans race 2 54008]RKK75308.1 hypothetical protein BFJ71_g17133 [Fusarium oxysporum]